VVAPATLPSGVAEALGSGDLDGRELIVATTVSGEDLNPDRPLREQLYPVATLATILRSMRSGDGQARVLLHGGPRVCLAAARRRRGINHAMTSEFVEKEGDRATSEPLQRAVVQSFTRVAELSNINEELVATARNLPVPGALADLVAAHTHIGLPAQQELLAETDGPRRLESLYRYLLREERIVELRHEIQQKAREEIEQTQKEIFLREQIKALQKEIGAQTEGGDDVDSIRRDLAKRDLPQLVRDTAEKEIARLERIPMASPEYTVARGYLDWIVALPWDRLAEAHTDIANARRVLDEDHYDLAEVKDRILEYLAVMKLTAGHKAPILCFVGPPGTGKTSLGKSIARATERPFFRFSLGGMRDEAEIRGHRRTYIGSMPGRILKALKQTGVRNPVLMLDEIDKLGSDFRGDPASALLEVLDPEQNSTFTDNYLDLPFDLSQVLFVTTANVLDTIPPALRDRMEVIRLGGYTTSEKVEIGQRYIVPRQMEANGLRRSDIAISKPVVREVIEKYTREAGLRGLERQIATICRKAAVRVAEEGPKAKKTTVKREDLGRFLGPPRHFGSMDNRPWRTGIARALAWTPFGGEVLYIEVNRVAGHRNFRLTGQLGEVMKESASAAYSYLRSHAPEMGLKAKDFDQWNLHIHLPAGAIPKDGPSAGIALATAMASEILGLQVDRRVAMTGEITLKGLVLPIGGVKEKSLAAARAGVKRLILPEQNRSDLEKVPDEVKKKIEFVFVSRMDEVLPVALKGFRFAAPDKQSRSGKKASRTESKRRADESPRSRKPAARKVVAKKESAGRKPAANKAATTKPAATKPRAGRKRK
jgi:ATP-dependent Lon protease